MRRLRFSHAPVKAFFERRAEMARSEDAFVMAMFAITLTALMTAAGFAIDIGNWYLHAARMQRAADAGALAGVVYMPDNFPTAEAVATATVKENGGTGGGSVSVEMPAGDDHKLSVSIDAQVPNHFVSLVGIDVTRVTRTAVSEYHPHMPLGAEDSVLGKEPVSDKSAGHLFWLSVAGGATEKRMGDRYTSATCTDVFTDACATGANAEHDSTGQTYVLNIPRSASGWVGVQAFDPVFAHVGTMCEDATLTENNKELIDWIADKTEKNRPAAGRTNERCTGDDITEPGTPMSTTFQLFYPETAPGGSTPVPSCKVTYPGINTNVYSAMVAAGKGSLLETGFRDWSQFCKLLVTDSTPRGDYLVKVTTGATEKGLNRFSLRSGTLSGPGLTELTTSSSLKLHAKNHIVMTNGGEGNAQNEYPLATLPMGSGNRVSVLEFFDIGDNLDPASGAGRDGEFDLDAIEYDGRELDDCQIMRPGEFTFEPLGGCRINNAEASAYDGQVVTIKVRLPLCESESGCRLNAVFKYEDLSKGEKSADTFTFEGSLSGSPVRLTPNL